MEYSRFQANKRMYILGFTSLIICIALLLFSLYLMPYAFWGFRYDIPEEVIGWVEYFQYHYKFGLRASGILVLSFFLVPAVIAGAIAYFAANNIDDMIYGLKKENTTSILTPEAKADMRETFRFSVKIIFLIALVFLVAAIFEWLVSIPPP